MQGMFVMMTRRGSASPYRDWHNRSRLPERAAYAPRPAAGPLALRAKGRRTSRPIDIVPPDVPARCSPFEPSTKAARAMVVVDRAQKATSPTAPVIPRTGRRPTITWGDDAGLEGVLTDVGFSNAVLAQQMYGGHGLYRRERAWSSSCAIARIAMIYEGANGIQALDLVGAKLPREAAAR